MVTRSMRTVAMLALLWAGVAAADCPRPEGTGGSSISSRSDEERLRFLATNLGQQADASFRWTLGWGLTYGVLTIGQLAVMPAFHEVDWPDWYWGAITSALGIPLVFAASPGLHAVDHAVYDVWLTDCKTSSPVAPPGSR